MGPNVSVVSFPDAMPRLLRVAAYARVSSGKDAMLHSLSAQISYYSELIQNHAGWQYAGVFADEAKTGTKDSRDAFQRLLDECRAGNVDRIITKSISRFARNTVTLLETIRELKALGISVYFEEQNIDTSTADGELMVTILASYAQEESLSASENQKWRVKRNFEQGLTWNGTVLGYRPKDGVLEIVPEEAEIVQRIFAEYLSGKGCSVIARELNEDGIPTRRGVSWCAGSVNKVLSNYHYTGNLLLHRKYREDHITKRTKNNTGELPQFHAEDTHQAIIDMDTFQVVQDEMRRRAERFCCPTGKSPAAYPFTGLLVCAHCGKHYRRKTTVTGIVWICSTYNTQGKAACPSKQIPESTLEAVTATVTDDIAAIDHITVCDGNRLLFAMKDGSVAKRTWKDRSRAESWTPEMRERARQQNMERRARSCRK